MSTVASPLTLSGVRPRRIRASATAALAATAFLIPAPAAGAQTSPARPIPEGTGSTNVPAFTGTPAVPDPVFAPDPPRHPHMAANGRSNLHDDAYMTDTYQGPGPLGRDAETLSTFMGADCASVTFDGAGRIVTICVGIEGPRLVLLDPRTLDQLASLTLPPRNANTTSIFNDFTGGGYFYLDDRDRAVIPTNDRRVLVVSQVAGANGISFRIERNYDVSGALPGGDEIVSVLPDWSGRIWFVSEDGVVATLDPQTGVVKAHRLGEEVANSFSVDETGGVYLVSARALYRFDGAADGAPEVSWREEYGNSGVAKPGQVDAGSGTTPTLMGDEYVSITDNADPMNVVVYRRARKLSGGRLVCEQPVFEKGGSATDNSLVATPTAMVVENNYGYTGPSSTENGFSTTPGLERVDIDRDGRGCHTVWKSAERAPSVVPKLSLRNGLVYTYTKDPEPGAPNPEAADPWYLTALDFRTGRTVWKRLTGRNLGYNNNYAPVTLGPDGTAYIGALGGLVLVRDRGSPLGVAPRAPRLGLTLRRRNARRLVAVVDGNDRELVSSVGFRFGRRHATVTRAPFAKAIRSPTRSRRRVIRLRAYVTLHDGRRLRFGRKFRRVPSRRAAR